MRLPITEISRLISNAIARHASQTELPHAARSVKVRHLGILDSISLKIYTDTTRPAATSLPAGTVIYNSTDSGLNVTDGTNWRAPSGGWVVT